VTGKPQQLLSRAAVLVSQGAIDSMLAAASARALTLRLVDVTPGANITHHLREWAGEFTTTPDGPHGLLVTFKTPQAHKAASDALAGGIRGLFRVDRSSTAAAAAPAGAGSSSRAAAAASRRPAAAAAAAGSFQPGWLTVGGNKGRNAAAAAPAAPDPWADDDAGSRAGRCGALGASSAAVASAVPRCVVDDWEDEDSAAEVALPPRPAVQLEQHNMWDALTHE
jgi:hypothetical protein